MKTTIGLLKLMSPVVALGIILMLIIVSMSGCTSTQACHTYDGAYVHQEARMYSNRKH